MILNLNPVFENESLAIAYNFESTISTKKCEMYDNSIEESFPDLNVWFAPIALNFSL